MMKSTSPEIFRKKYLSELPDDFEWQQTPIQVYPFDFISEYLLFPTPLLKPDYYYIVYLEKGEYRQQIGTEIYDIGPSSLVFSPEGSVFSIKEMKNKLTGFFIQIESKVISSIINDYELAELLTLEIVIELNKIDDHWIRTVLKLIYSEISSKTPNREIGIALFKALLHKMIELSPDQKKISRQREVAIKFKQLVNKNFIDHKSVAFYADALSMTENYLNRCVKSEYNKSCKQIILSTAIWQSQMLMFNSTDDISEISYQVGFEDPSHFSRTFKKVTGKTPSEFKNQIMHDLS